MNRFFFTLIILSLPVFCSAQGFRMTSEEYWFLVIIGVIFILLFAAVLVIMLLNWLENRKSRKNKQQSPPAQDKKALFELEQKLKGKKEMIDSLNEQIDKLQNDKKDLQNVIDGLEKRLSFQENEKSKEVIKSQNRSEIRLNIKEESERYSQDYGFIYLTVLEGPLVEARPEHTVYYKAWREKGKLLFEFVNNDRTKKAINNRTSIIEPFCEKVESSKSPDDSEMITTISPGLLNDDYTVRDKAKIEYK